MVHNLPFSHQDGPHFQEILFCFFLIVDFLVTQGGRNWPARDREMLMPLVRFRAVSLSVSQGSAFC